MKTLNSNVTIERHNRTSSCSRPEFQNKRKETRLATSQLQTTNQVKKKKRDERHQCGVHSSIFYTFGIQDISSSMVLHIIIWPYNDYKLLSASNSYYLCTELRTMKTANSGLLARHFLVCRPPPREDERIWYSVQCLVVKPVSLILHFFFPPNQRLAVWGDFIFHQTEQ